MKAADYDAQYNNRALVPEHPDIIESWVRDAAAYRAAAGELHGRFRYGPSDRQAIDLFEPAASRRGATVLFIHGGYWQALDRSLFSHMAQGLNAHGIAVAVPGYDLCPQVRVVDIVDQMREACRALAGRGRLVVAGHSAGGHLAACLLATEWSKLDLPADLVPAAYAISGLFDLEPLRHTYVNDALGMDEAEARRLSPLHWAAPPGRVFDAVVGGAESSEYLRQSRTMAESWGKVGVHTRYEAVPGANHFTVIAPLADRDSAMTGRLVELATSV